ncbi:MAG: hypothetical protein JO269_09550 [Burkholderiaceae bacterium]|nr:hypothetical protein [Burkholderiaceae bacterium]
MGIIGKYARATQSSNLMDDELHHNTEPLAAVALSGGADINAIGNLLFRVKYANDATSYNHLLESWIKIVAGKAVTRKWPSHILAPIVAKVSLDHFLNDVCPACSGKGHLPIFGAPILSDDPCRVCDGRGTLKVSADRRCIKQVEDMVETLNDFVRMAAGNAMRKLADDMEL